MTKFYINVTISCKNSLDLQQVYRNKNMGGYAGVSDKMSPLQCETLKSYTRNYKMKELHANLTEAANYLIECFNATGQIYSCSRTKIGKLLSIVAFLYAKNDTALFDETIYKYDGCGTTIEELKSFIDRDVYIKLLYADDRNPIDISFSARTHLDKLSNINLSSEVKRDIELVFTRFGAFIPSDLGQCINPIVKYIESTNNEGLDLSKIQTFSIDTFKEISADRELIEFLYAPLEINNGEQPNE